MQVAIIQYSMKAAGMFDVFFVNSFKLPFFSGFTIYFIALAAVIGWALTFTERNISKNKLIIWFVLFLGLICSAFLYECGIRWRKICEVLIDSRCRGSLIGYFLKPGSLKSVEACYVVLCIYHARLFCLFHTLIRSNADPAIDMNNVDNPINLVYYLSREQYGSAPLVYGPHFAAEVARDDNGYAESD